MKICPTCKTQYEGGEVFCPVDAARLVTGSQLDGDPANAGDPFLTFTCPGGSGAVLAESAGGARDFRCLEGGAPSATLDVKRALAANDARTVALCKSRAYLREHMDDEGRALFTKAFSDCNL